jgi:hypothetical protein
MFHLLHTYVASILFGYCICCSDYAHMLQAYVSNVSPCFRFTLQQVLLPTYSNSRARTLYIPSASAAYLCHASQLQQLNVHTTGGQCQTAEYSLVKMYTRMQSARVGPAPLHHQAWPPIVQHAARSTQGTCALLLPSHAVGQAHTRMLSHAERQSGPVPLHHQVWLPRYSMQPSQHKVHALCSFSLACRWAGPMPQCKRSSICRRPRT